MGVHTSTMVASPNEAQSNPVSKCLMLVTSVDVTFFMYPANCLVASLSCFSQSKYGRSVPFEMLYAVSTFDSVAPYFSVASTIFVVVGAEFSVMKSAQSMRVGFAMKAAETLLWPSCPEMGSDRKLPVMAMRAMLLSWVSGTWATSAT